MPGFDLITSIREIEAARDDAVHPSFVGTLFDGQPDFDQVFPFPRQTEEDKRIGDAVYGDVARFLHDRVDPAAIERTGNIPPDVLDGLAQLGCFGLKIPREYGGLGLSLTNYNRVLQLIASVSPALGLLLSAHQSVGVAQALILFGSEEQRRQYLPLLATGKVSAFALTEPAVGSDPANMTTTAVLDGGSSSVPQRDEAAEARDAGTHYVINGEKLWCSNGTIADFMTLMAKVQGRITAFIVPMSTPGVEVVQRCEFMGFRGLENAYLRLTDVRIPRENMIGRVGEGLKIALTTLNTGRISVAAMCVGMAKQVYEPTLSWATSRKQLGDQIGRHELNTHKLAYIATHIFASEAVTKLVASYAERHDVDFRVESAVAKLTCSMYLQQILDHAMALRGGRGYEKAASLRKREGEIPFPMERLLRDGRLFVIVEGASEVMKLFVSREVMAPHIKLALRWLLNTEDDFPTILGSLGGHYLPWYVRQVLPQTGTAKRAADPQLAGHLRYVETTSRRLARVLFQQLMRTLPEYLRGRGRFAVDGDTESFQQATLDLINDFARRQAGIVRYAEIGIDLFMMATVCSYAESFEESERPEASELAHLFCLDARTRIEQRFRALQENHDEAATRVGLRALGAADGSRAGKQHSGYRFLADGIAEQTYA
ncbi:MAG: DNA polymerase II [Dehalococcoidia bacterium]|nr:DNA polymerase II [Dehalococcoidia bacterium]